MICWTISHCTYHITLFFNLCYIFIVWCIATMVVVIAMCCANVWWRLLFVRQSLLLFCGVSFFKLLLICYRKTKKKQKICFVELFYAYIINARMDITVNVIIFAMINTCITCPQFPTMLFVVSPILSAMQILKTQLFASPW